MHNQTLSEQTIAEIAKVRTDIYSAGSFADQGSDVGEFVLESLSQPKIVIADRHSPAWRSTAQQK